MYKLILSDWIISVTQLLLENFMYMFDICDLRACEGGLNKMLILVENIHVVKSHINEICEECLKTCLCKILFVF
jgi:hypothetical protein